MNSDAAEPKLARGWSCLWKAEQELLPPPAAAASAPALISTAAHWPRLRSYRDSVSCCKGLLSSEEHLSYSLAVGTVDSGNPMLEIGTL